MLDRLNIDKNKITYLINKIDYNTNYKIWTSNMKINYFLELSYIKEIYDKFNTPMLKLTGREHSIIKYLKQFKILMREIFKIEYTQEELEISSNIDIIQLEKKKQEEPIQSKQIEQKISSLKTTKSNNETINNNEQKENNANKPKTNKRSILQKIFTIKKKKNNEVDNGKEKSLLGSAGGSSSNDESNQHIEQNQVNNNLYIDDGGEF